MTLYASVTQPRLLDLFCGGGGAAKGYQRAGFHVTGVDIKAQPRYCGEEFVQGDALEFCREHGHEFDVIHASPPCQSHIKGLAAVNRLRGRKPRHQDLIPQTRAAIEKTGLPYVIENVEGAPLLCPIKVCGTYFNLPIRRHRLFESNLMLFGVDCRHQRFREKRFYSSYGQFRGRPPRMTSTVVQVFGNPSNAAKKEWGPALGIDWMDWRELSQAIPPCYTFFIGKQLMSILEGRSCSPAH